MSDLAEIVIRMATREATAHLLAVPVAESSPGITAPAEPVTVVRHVPCPVCGLGPADARLAPGPDLDGWRFAIEGEPAPDDVSELTLLGCEWITPRSLLPTVVASARFGPLRFRSRAVCWISMPDGDVTQRLGALDASESWVDALTEPESATARRRCLGSLTVPAATRTRPRPHGVLASVFPSGLRSSMLSPHPVAPALTALETRYADVRRDAVLAAFA